MSSSEEIRLPVPKTRRHMRTLSLSSVEDLAPSRLDETPIIVGFGPGFVVPYLNEARLRQLYPEFGDEAVLAVESARIEQGYSELQLLRRRGFLHPEAESHLARVEATILEAALTPSNGAVPDGRESAFASLLLILIQSRLIALTER